MKYLPFLILAFVFSFTPLMGQTTEDVKRVAYPTLAEGNEVLIFESKTIDLGRFSEDSVLVEGYFTLNYKAKGKAKPIMLLKLVSTCGCLEVDSDKKLLNNGESTKIRYKYHPKGFPGKLNRRIFIYTSLSSKEPSAIINLIGEVEPTKDKASNYRYSMGVLALKQRELSFKEAQKVTVERINCYNNSDHPLRLSVLGFAPKGLEFSTEPKVIEARSEGKIVVRHIPALWKGQKEYELIINGVTGKPSQRIIKVNLDY